MKNEWTEQDLRQFVESSRPVFQDVSLTQVDEDADRCWQDDGLMVDYELRGGQVDCVLRRCVVADGKVWQLQMTAPLAGNDLRYPMQWYDPWLYRGSGRCAATT